MGAGIFVCMFLYSKGGGCASSHRNGLASLCMDGAVDSPRLLSTIVYLSILNQLVAPAVPLRADAPVCLFYLFFLFFF